MQLICKEWSAIKPVRRRVLLTVLTHAFAESIALRDEKVMAESRQALLAAAGPAVLVDAAGVAANFQRMVRIADAIGIPVDYMDSTTVQGIQQELGLKEFASARHSLKSHGD